MIDLDRASLDRVLPVTAGSSDWDDVLGRCRTQARRRRLITLAVVAVTAIVATASSFAVRAIVFDGGRSVTALPPWGTKPSTPAAGRIVLNFHGRAGGVVQVWVYADGRIIRRAEGGPAGVGAIRTGFIEQRLTDEGVKLLGSKILATRLVERDHAFRHWTFDFGSVRVWNGTRLVTVEWGDPPVSGKRATVPTDEQKEAIARLIDWILDPAAALPRRAWEDRTPRAYVPARYAICYRRAREPDYFPRSVRPSRALPFFPAEARDLLRNKTRAFRSFGWRSECSELTIEDARVLYGILGKSGYEPDPFAAGKTPVELDGLTNNVRFRAPRPNQTLFIAFEPILPHGQWELMPG